MDKVILIGFYGLCYAAFNWWHENTEVGRNAVKWLRGWKTDSFLHLILCAGSVYILGVCAILAIGLTFMVFGL